MTTYWVRDATPEQVLTLWELATFNTRYVVVRMSSTEARRALPGVIRDVLLSCGTVQPSLGQPRRSERADIGRAQVAVHRAGMDLVLLGGTRMPGPDVGLLDEAMREAGRNLYLVDDDSLGPRSNPPSGSGVCPADDLVSMLESHPGRDTRRTEWDCGRLLVPGSGLGAGCGAHADAVECVLSWSGHAFATGRATEVSLMARFHELGRGGGDRRWAVLARARDVYPFADQAVASVSSLAERRRDLQLSDLATDASAVTVAGETYPVPPHVRAVLAAQRDVRIADRWSPDDPLLVESFRRGEREVRRRNSTRR